MSVPNSSSELLRKKITTAIPVLKMETTGALGKRRKKNDYLQLSTSTTRSRIMTLQSLNAGKCCLQISKYKSRERKFPRCFTKHTLFNYSFILTISVKFKLGLIFQGILMPALSSLGSQKNEISPH